MVGLMAGGQWMGLMAASAAAVVLLYDKWETPQPAKVPVRRKRVNQAKLHGPAWTEWCSYCRQPAEAWDHIVPFSQGGSEQAWNKTPACTACNSSKGDRTPEEWWGDIGGGRPFPPFWPRSV